MAVSGLGSVTQKKRLGGRQKPPTRTNTKAPETRDQTSRVTFFAPPSGQACVEHSLSPGYTLLVVSRERKMAITRVHLFFFFGVFSHNALGVSNADGRFVEFHARKQPKSIASRFFPRRGCRTLQHACNTSVYRLDDQARNKTRTTYTLHTAAAHHISTKQRCAGARVS